MAKSYKILCLSDDIELLKQIKLSAGHDYQISSFRDPDCAWRKIRDSHYSALIIDQTLNGQSGQNFIAFLRKQAIELPIVLITENDNSKFNVNAWNAGADVVMAKPVKSQLILAQCRALVNRYVRKDEEFSYVREAQLNSDQQYLLRDGKRVDLARREHAILKLLLRYRGHTVQRDHLHDQTQRYDKVCTDNVLDVHISNLRKKLHYLGIDKGAIKTVYGVGYKLEG